MESVKNIPKQFYKSEYLITHNSFIKGQQICVLDNFIIPAALYNKHLRIFIESGVCTYTVIINASKV